MKSTSRQLYDRAECDEEMCIVFANLQRILICFNMREHVCILPIISQ